MTASPRAGFFGHKPPGRAGLALFLNAGDPPLGVLSDVLFMLDECGVDCLELAVPFPDSVTDGPVIRRSAGRALAGGTGLDQVLAFVGSRRSRLSHLRIALMADWGHTVRPLPVRAFLERVAGCGADGLLIHGVPPRARPHYYEGARDIGLPVITTCYATSPARVMADAAAHASAFVYLVAHYGRSGSTLSGHRQGLAMAVTALRERAKVPVAVGFGIRSRADVAAVHGLGADAAVVGSAGVARVEQAMAAGLDITEEMRSFTRELMWPATDPKENRDYQEAGRGDQR